MGKVKKNILVEHAEIVDVSSEGKAVAKAEGMVIFTEGAVPGDVGDILVHRKKSSYAEGKMVQLRKPSPNRVAPVCEHFGTCGGCKWQNLDYTMQLHFKQKTVFDALTRIGKLAFDEIRPIIGSKQTYHYRNKLDFSFSDKKWLTPEEIQSGTAFNRNALGFHIPGMFDKVLDIENCYLQPDPSNPIRQAVKAYALEHQLPFFDIRNKQGMLRTLLIRTTSTGEVMVLFAFCEATDEQISGLLSHISKLFPQITSLQYVINTKANDTFQDLEVVTFSGRDHIFEEMEGLKFKISAKSFYQTNSQQAYELYKVARDFAGLTGQETVYDLYTGTGTIANFIARQSQSVVGIEYVEDSIKDARVNAALNGIENTVFYAGDMKDVLTEDLIARHGVPQVIITDPPRAGMHEDVVRTILKANPAKVVYVSCNPATQARDLAMMTDQYRITRVQPVDMFPQTAHVENVVLLERA